MRPLRLYKGNLQRILISEKGTLKRTLNMALVRDLHKWLEPKRDDPKDEQWPLGTHTLIYI